MSDNEIYLLIKYIKSVLWRVAKRLSYMQDARCLKVKPVKIVHAFCVREKLSKEHATCSYSFLFNHELSL